MTDHDAMKNCPPQLMYLIETKGLMLEQVFNAEEMGLFWKRMPSCTFLSKQEIMVLRVKVTMQQTTSSCSQ